MDEQDLKELYPSSYDVKGNDEVLTIKEGLN